LEFNVPFQHKYGYIRDEPNSEVEDFVVEAKFYCLHAFADGI